MIYSLACAVAWQPIPKCAATSTRAAFISQMRVGGDNADAPVTPADIAEIGNPALDYQMEPGVAVVRLEHPAVGTYWKYAIVRNPFDRLVSAYRQARRMLVRRTLAMYFPEDRDQWTFENFANNVCAALEAGTSGIDQHVRLQSQFLAGRIFDYTGRWESLPAVWENIKAQTKMTVDFPWKNNNGSVDYHTFYAGLDTLRDRVAAAYAADLTAFGYTF